MRLHVSSFLISWIKAKQIQDFWGQNDIDICLISE